LLVCEEQLKTFSEYVRSCVMDCNLPSCMSVYLRGFVFIASLVYFMLPRWKWTKLLQGGSAWIFKDGQVLELESVATGIIVFIIVGISLTGLSGKIIPKNFHPFIRVFTCIPEFILNQIDPPSWDVDDHSPIERSVDSHRLWKRDRRRSRENVLTNIIQMVLLIFLARLIVKFLFFRATSIVVMVLFDSTRYTWDLVLRIASWCVRFPLGTLVVLPIVRRTAWYYLLAYFTICGGSCFVLVFGISTIFMLIWKNFILGGNRIF
jgi:hypothetical protein